MTLRLVIERSRHPQPAEERDYHGGTLAVGRGDKADWRLNDPDKSISRLHFTIAEAAGGVLTVTDSSRFGLFVDGSSQALGAGNSLPLEDGMRLRLGDFVIRIDLGAAATEEPVALGPARRGPFDFEFGTTEETPPEPQRPPQKPDPVHRPGERSWREGREDEARRALRPLDWKDPFGLDLRRQPSPPSDPVPPPGEPVEDQGEARPSGGFDFFPDAEEAESRARHPTPPDDPPVARRWPGSTAEESVAPEISRSFRRGEMAPRRPFEAPPEPKAERPPDIEQSAEAPPEPPLDPSPQPRVKPARSEVDQAKDSHPPDRPVPTDGDAAWAAVRRGLKLPPRDLPHEELEARMEALGRQYRLLATGLYQLIRTRAEAKQSLRIEGTVFGTSEVNPLKVLGSPDALVEALLSPAEPGFQDGERAIAEGVRDLADHQARTWDALQTALHSMIDRFDPDRVEEELGRTGLLERLAAGGRSAKLWQIYRERFQQIARSAEKRFLGEVGADFRDAYERKGGQRDE